MGQLPGRRPAATAPGAPGAPGGSWNARSRGSGEGRARAVRASDRSGEAPSESALKALLFPSTAAVAVDAQEIRFISREAFPNLMRRNRRSTGCSG